MCFEEACISLKESLLQSSWYSLAMAYQKSSTLYWFIHGKQSWNTKNKDGAKVVSGSTASSSCSVLIGISLRSQVALCWNPVMDIMSSLAETLGEYSCITQGQWVIVILGCRSALKLFYSNSFYLQLKLWGPSPWVCRSLSEKETWLFFHLWAPGIFSRSTL